MRRRNLLHHDYVVGGILLGSARSAAAPDHHDDDDRQQRPATLIGQVILNPPRLPGAGFLLGVPTSAGSLAEGANHEPCEDDCLFLQSKLIWNCA
jgi:hypothetical protein